MTTGCSEHNYVKVKCDCCGTETLAEIKDNKLIIIDRRHGRRHVAVLNLFDIISKMRQLSINFEGQLEKTLDF